MSPRQPQKAPGRPTRLVASRDCVTLIVLSGSVWGSLPHGNRSLTQQTCCGLCAQPDAHTAGCIPHVGACVSPTRSRHPWFWRPQAPLAFPDEPSSPRGTIILTSVPINEFRLNLNFG